MAVPDPVDTSFHDLSKFVALPRLSGLTISPDGKRLVTTVAAPSSKTKKYVSTLWEIDPTNAQEPRQLTRSGAGESQPVFLPDGSLLFTSARPDTESAGNENNDNVTTLWQLPPTGEAQQIASRPGSITAVYSARDCRRIIFTAHVMPGVTDIDEDEETRKQRKQEGVTGILHDRYPVRYWDHDLGPDESRLFASNGRQSSDELIREFKDLTPEPNGSLCERLGLALSPDGSRAAAVWHVELELEPASWISTIVTIDTTTGQRETVAHDGDAEFYEPCFVGNDQIVCIRESRSTWDKAPRITLWSVDLNTGEGRDLLTEWELWPHKPFSSIDGSTVFFVADEDGHAPIFRLDLKSGQITRLTASGAYSDLAVAPDGTGLYALETGIDCPPTPVSLDCRTADQRPTRLATPSQVGPLPGRVVDVSTASSDGTQVRGWLVLPPQASATTPAPLLLWIHGGPLHSWNSWSWRWNPWLMAAAGYGVLLPDPALSVGYGQEFVQRGWGAWGDRPYADLMAITDAACARDDIDNTRTAAMGGSFGGYMANWIAGQTDRFRAIVSHASLWNLDQFIGTTDVSSYWQQEFGDPLLRRERYIANSPHLQAGRIRTPMLVIHGDRDYRVPIGEGMRLWYDLVRHEVPAKFLYFPDENHWVLTPGNTKIWYETVFAFLAAHVLDQKWKRPELL